MSVCVYVCKRQLCNVSYYVMEQPVTSFILHEFKHNDSYGVWLHLQIRVLIFNLFTRLFQCYIISNASSRVFHVLICVGVVDIEVVLQKVSQVICEGN